MEHPFAPGFPISRWLQHVLRRPTADAAASDHPRETAIAAYRSLYPLWMWRCAVVLPPGELASSGRHGGG